MCVSFVLFVTTCALEDDTVHPWPGINSFTWPAFKSEFVLLLTFLLTPLGFHSAAPKERLPKLLFMPSIFAVAKILCNDSERYREYFHVY